MNDSDELTLQEVADLLGVHYMTAYRYVRTGRLAASKGKGAWRVRLLDLDEMRRGGPALAPPRVHRSTDWAHRLERRILAGDEAGAWAVIEAACTSGRSPEAVHLDVIGPALRRVGERWERGEIDEADEHLATAVATRLIGRLGPRFARRGRRRGRVVLAGPAGERHALPLAMAADVLRGHGYEAIDLGPDVPPSALASIVAAEARERLVAVGLCVTTGRPVADLRDAITAIRDAAPAVPVVVGGSGLAALGDVIELLGIEHRTATVPDLVATVEQLTHRRTPTAP